ncbi:SpoIIE family protein phosphatase [Streptomyces sp. 6N223]|uniref:SpoIIE family protein phosphatase n=1 Tax=Streptomyces sp. 6N223 TaxID=3457412 RepID=UPI003FD58774
MGHSGRGSDLAATGRPCSLLDLLRVGIVMLDARGQVTLWSPVTEEILGWPKREAVGRHLSDFVPAGRPAPGTAVYRALLRDGHWRGTLALRHRDGHVVSLEARASLLRDDDGVPCILANLVETSRLDAVEQDLATLDALFAALPQGIGIFDTDRRLVRLNDALARLGDAPAEKLVGRTALELLPPPMAREIHRLQGEVLRTGRPVVDLVISTPDDGAAHSFSLSRLTDRDGRTLGVGCVSMDVTERIESLVRVERTRESLALLDDIGSALANLLDVRRISDTLARLLVPRFADYASVTLLEPVANGGDLPRPGDIPHQRLVRVAVGAKRSSPEVTQMMRLGQEFPADPRNVIGAAVLSGTPRLYSSEEEILATAPGDRNAAASHALGIHSMITAPLPARGTVLGLLTLTRAEDRAPFDRQDLSLATEVVARAGVSLDNARLYAQERERAVTLQRSLLPRSVPSLPGVGVSYRYVPAGVGSEVGGDWFDVIPLTRGRVAFVVGDVTGHGLRAAATMGRLRTAVRTLAGLDLSPAELLRRVNDLSEDIARHPDDPMMATCLYAVFDPDDRGCTLAKAGHMPPVLYAPGDPRHPERPGEWTARLLELPSGVPLGVEGGVIEERRVEVPSGAMLVMYTDGLIETRGGDINEGMRRLCDLLSRTARPGISLEALCDRIIETIGPGPEDDIALLAARLGS